jgi:hypothetical protein
VCGLFPESMPADAPGSPSGKILHRELPTLQLGNAKAAGPAREAKL